ncbi:MAG: ATP12 family protein [Pseudomonadota bacterium]
MSDWVAKRFWKEVSVADADGGYLVRLDARELRAPGKTRLLLPSRALAERVADEWRAQDEVIRADAMPITRIANSATEKVPGARSAVIESLTEFGTTDLLCYRAESPAELVARQGAAWDPWLEWVVQAHGAALRTTAGIMPVAQDQASIEALARPVRALTNFELAAFHDLVHLSGSAVLALAVEAGELHAQRAWDLSRIDDEWQIEQWGLDPEAEEMARKKNAAFLLAEQFLSLVRTKP